MFYKGRKLDFGLAVALKSKLQRSGYLLKGGIFAEV